MTVLTTRSTSARTFLPGPLPGTGTSPRALSLIAGINKADGSGRYLVIRGLLQHLRAQIGAELELPAPKIAPGQEQRLHLRAHGGGGAGREGPAPGPGRAGGEERAASSSARQRAAAGALPERRPASRLRTGKRMLIARRTQH